MWLFDIRWLSVHCLTFMIVFKDNVLIRLESSSQKSSPFWRAMGLRSELSQSWTFQRKPTSSHSSSVSNLGNQSCLTKGKHCDSLQNAIHGRRKDHCAKDKIIPALKQCFIASLFPQSDMFNTAQRNIHSTTSIPHDRRDFCISWFSLENEYFQDYGLNSRNFRDS